MTALSTSPITPPSNELSAALAAFAAGNQGTLVSLVTRKKGVQRGKPPVTYEDDLVQVLLWSGFHYRALAQRSYMKLHELWSSGSLVSDLVREAIQAGCVDVTVTDANEAVQELSEALRIASLGQDDPDAGLASPSEEDERVNVYEPLLWDGVKVVGAKRYIGAGDANNPRSPKPGSIYIEGVKLGEVVVDKALNGNWTSASKPKTVVKNLLKDKLPNGLFARYGLDPDRVVSLKVGKEAADAAKAGGIRVDPEVMQSLFKDSL